MLSFASFCFLALPFVQQLVGKESPFVANVRLLNMLLKDYNNSTRPVLNVRDNVTVTIGISLYQIENMDDKNQMLTWSLWIRQVWLDRRLSWRPANFSSLKKINIPVKSVWRPDIKVYNEVNAGLTSGLDQFKTRVVVHNNGRVQWMGPINLRTSCKMDMRMYPYDVQTCRLKVGSWMHHGSDLDVKPESYVMDISKSASNLLWKVVGSRVERNVQFYPCCLEPFPDVTYIVKLERRSKSYGLYFIFPALLLSALTMLAFVTTGERIGLVLTSLVSLFFFLKMVLERTPPSDSIPILSIYYIVLSIEVMLVIYAVSVTLNVCYRRTNLNMNNCVGATVIGKLGGLWGLTDARNEVQLKIERLGAIVQKTENLLSRGNPNEQDASPSGTLENVHFWKDVDRKSCSIAAGKGLSATCAGIEMYVDVATEGLSENKNGLNERSRCKRCKKHGSMKCCKKYFYKLITLDKKLISFIGTINFIARSRDCLMSVNNYWLIASFILDKSLFIFFVSTFVIMTILIFLI
ncbi:neuronal acetylcholine receptor subunit alpha-10-like isoform X1 [Xenia sp. Carnegie-2017]|uniref:neuronal acetylcholine receptor subunit alpha-10-like isoform X1 n=1 Tax=Xenia sp. Carnegie-2017 TaxID=2897299 RepID=UPI001F04D28F|nr:neuronal acetylcholine receptor subunit alpha-10-like isoform X1 [Xenia sp. Carnegie-2017]